MNNNFNNKNNNSNIVNKDSLDLKKIDKSNDFLLENQDSNTPINVSSITVKIIDSKLNTEISHIDKLISERKKKNKLKKQLFSNQENKR